MEKETFLSRVGITGKVDSNTPLIVILEIAECHNLETDHLKTNEDVLSLIERINEENVPRVFTTLSLRDYLNISFFVNGNCEWPVEDLHKAFLYLKSFVNPSEFNSIEPDFSFGPQTPENIYSLNVCVVYAACRYFQIEMNYSSEEDYMVNSLRTCLTKSEIVINSIVTSLFNMDIKDILKIKTMIYNYQNPKKKKSLKASKESRKVKEVDQSENIKISEPFVDLVDSANILKDSELKEISPQSSKKVKYVRPTYEELKKEATDISRYYPTKKSIKDLNIISHIQAVVVASLYYNADIYDSKNPIKSLEAIKKDGAKRNDFNVLYPPEMYSLQSLTDSLEREGFPKMDMLSGNEIIMTKEEIYEQLQIISLSNNFVHGKAIPTINKETLVELEPVDKLREDNCISYGNKNDGYHVLMYTELYQTLKTSNNLINPVNNETLIDANIKKIKYLSMMSRYSRESDESYDKRIKIGDLINKLEDDALTQGMITIKRKVKVDSTETNKEAVATLLKSLVELSMNMRGWDGKDKYPIKDSYSLDQVIIYRRVSESILQIELYSSSFPEICDDVLNLPLVKYKSGSYILSDLDNGLTIKGRIAIIKNNKDVHACIRLSSNWLASSAYKYSKMLDIDPGFDIAKMKHIF